MAEETSLLEQIEGETLSLEGLARGVGNAEELDYRKKELDLRLREQFGQSLLWVHAGVNVFVIYILVATLVLKAFRFPTLSDQVLIALIAGTVAELAGLLLAITRYLFPRQTEK